MNTKHSTIAIITTVALATLGCTTKKSEVVKPPAAGATDQRTVDPGSSDQQVPEQGATKSSTQPKGPVLVDNRGANGSTEASSGDQVGDAGIAVITGAPEGAADEADPASTATRNPSTDGTVTAGQRSREVETTSLKYKDFTEELTATQVDAWVTADKAKRSGNIGYAVMPSHFLGKKDDMNLARIGLSKAINSVAMAATEIHNPIDVSEGHGLVFALELDKYWGAEAAQKWSFTAAGRQQRAFSPITPQQALPPRAFDGSKAVPFDRLVYNMLHGGMYIALTDMEASGTRQKQKLGINPQTPPTIRSGVKDAIVKGPRFMRRLELPNGQGAYWESFDDFNGRRTDLPWRNGSLPYRRFDGMYLDRTWTTVASESWSHMKNGMINYYIWGNANQRRSKAEISFVVDPLNPKSGSLLNGSCIYCHVGGTQVAPADMWKHAEENSRVSKEFWSDQEKITEAYIKDRKIFQDAMTKVVLGISDGTPEYNESVYGFTLEKEPCFFTVGQLIGSPRAGNHDFRQPANGQSSGGQNGRQAGGYGGQSGW